jgi:hypothetical protein
VGGLNTILALEVGNGPGDLEYPPISFSAEAEFIDGQFQQFLARLVNLAELNAFFLERNNGPKMLAS